MEGTKRETGDGAEAGRVLKFRAYQDNHMLTQKESGVYATKAFLDRLYEDCVLMQFTGLKDKNGREIYEGDILTADGYPWKDSGLNYLGIVEYGGEGSAASFFVTKRLVNSAKRGISDGMSDILEDNGDWEILGNIYENPELLTAKAGG